MRKLKYLFFVVIFAVFFCGVVNAESIKINKVSENNNDYKFDVLIDGITNENNINVVEGVIYYDAKLIKNIEPIKSGDWEFKYRVENDKIIFISYAISNFAKNNTSLFNLIITLDETVEQKNARILINDLLTNNGESLFSFDKMSYKFESLSDSVLSEPPVIDKVEVEDKLENLFPDEKPVVDKNDEEEKEDETTCNDVSSENKIYQVVVENERDNFSLILWVVIIVLFTFNLVQVVVVRKLAYKTETSMDDSCVSNEYKKETSTRKKGVK